MATILIATYSGVRTFTDAGEGEMELPGKRVGALAAEPDGSCLAIIDEKEIWRRHPANGWSWLASASLHLQSLTSSGELVYAGAMEEATVLRVKGGGRLERLSGFEQVSGREKWFAGGPPLGVRAMAATSDGAAILAAVHVGGVPRSLDLGATWTPTMPIMHDVHEVCVHPSLPQLVAAAAAVGLCVSDDAGLNWRLFSGGPENPSSLAVTMLEDEVLFSVQDGPFAARSQLWRWPIGSQRIEQVRDGLPEWLEGKVDTGWLAARNGRTAVVDKGGNLWFSTRGASGWKRLWSGLGYTFGVALL